MKESVRSATRPGPLAVLFLVLAAAARAWSSPVTAADAVRPPPAGAEGPLELDLPQAIDAGLRQNRDLAVLQLSLESRTVSVSIARSPFRLSFRPEAYSEADADGGSLRYGVTALRKTTWGTAVDISAQVSKDEVSGLPNLYRGTVGIGLDQPLLRYFGPLVNREPLTAAERLVTAARREIELRRTDLVVRIAEEYEELLRLQRQLERDRETCDRRDRFFRVMQLRERQGRVSRVDVLRAEIKLGNAKLSLQGTDERLRSVRMDLADMLGLSPERQVVAVKSPRLTVEATDPGAGVAVALKNRLDYAQIISDCQDAARGVRIADRNLLPDLRMISRFQKVGEGDAASDSLQLDDHAWFAGLSLVSDFPMRAESDALQQAEINRRVAEIRVDAVRAAIERQVRQALLSYERVRSELALAEENYRLAQKRARLARRLFDRVNNDSFSVSEAEDELREAEGLWLSAEAAASTEAYRLLRVLGTLIDSPADLKPKAGA